MNESKKEEKKKQNKKQMNIERKMFEEFGEKIERDKIISIQRK